MKIKKFVIFFFDNEHCGCLITILQDRIISWVIAVWERQLVSPALKCVGFGVEDNSKIEGCTLKLFVFYNLIVGRREIRSFLVIDVWEREGA